MNKKLVAVIGPTASGKTRLGVFLAEKFNGEIISADSRQVYRKLDIGTGKDIDEYVSTKYHLIDIADVTEEYNLFRYKSDFINAYDDIVSRGKLPIMVGGSGLYVSSVIQDYKLKKWEQDINDLKDLETDAKKLKEYLSVTATEDLVFNVNSAVIGVRFDRKELKERITERLKQRLQTGMIEEVKQLLDNNISPQRLISLGLEYRYLTMYILGEISYNDMFQKLNSSIHAFAKRQMTWFRKMEREGVKIHWVERGDFNWSSEIVENFLKS
jgi:tRNA dimethylallyltransferase